jgi:hypothetical protein
MTICRADIGAIAVEAVEDHSEVRFLRAPRHAVETDIAMLEANVPAVADASRIARQTVLMVATVTQECNANQAVAAKRKRP